MDKKVEENVYVKKSQMADSRTCDFKNITENELWDSTWMHIHDVRCAIDLFRSKLVDIKINHDEHKIRTFKNFYKSFVSGFKDDKWLNEHYLASRHHINKRIHGDIDLFDILEYIADCTVAGIARSGYVYDLELSDDTLRRAFKNTVEWLKDRVILEDE